MQQVPQQPSSLRKMSFDLRLQVRVNALSQTIHQQEVLPLYRPPGPYTGELFGVEYLYQQSGYHFVKDEDNLDSQIDEGFEDYEDSPLDQLAAATIAAAQEDPSIVAPSESDSDDDDEEEEEEVRL